MKRIIYISLVFVLISCSSGGDPVEEEKVSNPEKTSLIFPENNSECLEGQIINSEKSTVTFKWNKAKFTTGYELSIKNLEDQSTKTYSTPNTSLGVDINRGTPYSWFITSKSSKSTATAKSEVWKFYNAGEALTEHVPFPAEATEPLHGAEVTLQGTVITLKWSASDLDNDITGYDIYFGETDTPDLYQSNVSSNQLVDINVTSGKVYYWKVKTIDSEDNSSMSDVFSFKIN